MSKSKLALLIDSIVISFIIFIVSFLWLRKFTKNANLSIILSIIISLVVFYVIFYKSIKRNKSLTLMNQNKKFNIACLNFLKYCSTKNYNDFFKTLLSAELVDSYIFKTKAYLIYINLKTESTDNNLIDFIDSIHNHANENLNNYILTTSSSNSFNDLFSSIQIKINTLSIETIFKLMEEKNFYPITKDAPTKTNYFKSTKDKFLSISRNQFKQFFFSGLSLIFISIIVPFSFLYLISGSFLLIFSMLSLLKKNIKSADANEQFLQTIKK